MSQPFAQLEAEKNRSEQTEQVNDAGNELAVGLSDEIEVTTGLTLAEGPSEGREMASEQGGGKSGGKTKKDDDKTAAQKYEERKKKLMAMQPKEAQMIKEIRKVLHEKLIKLEKEEAYVRRRGLKAIDNYVDLVAKIRHLRRLLRRAANASYKVLKDLWLKVVHGIV